MTKEVQKAIVEDMYQRIANGTLTIVEYRKSGDTVYLTLQVPR